MKKTSSCPFYLVLMYLCYTSCVKPPCECEPVPIQEIKCRIVNLQGRNLFFGTQATFRLDSFKVLRTPNDFSVHHASVDRYYEDSLSLVLNFYKPEFKSYFYYNRQTNSDSLEVEWKSEKGRCCGESFTHSLPGQVKFNGNIIQPQNGIYYFIRQ